MKDFEPMVSVIVPVYNAAEYLQKCISTIQNQTYKNIEIILVNDGSQDESGNICNNFGESDFRIKTFHVANGGVSKARNIGIEKALGKYITFIDSDDFVDLQYIELLVSMSEGNNADLSVCGVRKEDLTGKIITESCCKNKIYNTRLDFLNLLETDYSFFLMGGPYQKLYKKDIIDRYNLRFREDMSNSEDTLFVYDYLQHSNIIVTNNSIMYHYIVGKNESLNMRYDLNRIECVINCYKNVIEIYRSNGCNQKSCKHIYTKAFWSIYNPTVNYIKCSAPSNKEGIIVALKLSRNAKYIRKFLSCKSLNSISEYFKGILFLFLPLNLLSSILSESHFSD